MPILARQAAAHCHAIVLEKGMIMKRETILLASLLLAMVGCTSSVEGQKTEPRTSTIDNANLVRENTALAVEQCGEGNVRKVTVKGFFCFDK